MWRFHRNSILDQLRFLLHMNINDTVPDIGSDIRPFAADAGIYIVVEDPVSVAKIPNSDL